MKIGAAEDQIGRPWHAPDAVLLGRFDGNGQLRFERHRVYVVSSGHPRASHLRPARWRARGHWVDAAVVAGLASGQTLVTSHHGQRPGFTAHFTRP